MKSTTDEAASSDGVSLTGISFEYPGGPRLFDAIDLNCPRGSTTVIDGSNGCGKSTLLHLCAGVIAPKAGIVRIGGHRPSVRRPDELVRGGVRRGLVLQESGLLSMMNVLANVALPLHYHAESMGLEEASIEHLARVSLRRAGVGERDLFAFPTHLSFGTRRRVALARAIVTRPTHLFVDDPDVGLDPETASLLHGVLEEFAQDGTTTTIIATSRPFYFQHLPARRWTLECGSLIPAAAAPVLVA